MTDVPRSHMDSDPEKTDRATTAYLRLRRLIVHGQLAPGSRIVETELARKLELSRTPVRSALQRLQQEGFILAGRDDASRPVVAPLTREDAVEIFEIVGGLEAMAAVRAARLPSDLRSGVVRRLEEVNRALQALEREERPQRSRFFDLDSEFHAGYVESGAGPRLRALHDAVKPQAERYIRLYVSVLSGEISTSVEEHERIIDGIRSGASRTAQDAVQENWKNAADRLSRVIDAAGERGSW